MNLKKILQATKELEKELDGMVDDARTFNATLPKTNDPEAPDGDDLAVLLLRTKRDGSI